MAMIRAVRWFVAAAVTGLDGSCPACGRFCRHRPHIRGDCNHAGKLRVAACWNTVSAFIDSFLPDRQHEGPDRGDVEARVVEQGLVQRHVIAADVGLVGVDVGGQPQRVGVVGAATHQEHRRSLPRQRVQRGDELVGVGERGPTLDGIGPLLELRQRVRVVRCQALEPVIGVVRQEAVVGGEHDGLVAGQAGGLADLGVDLAVVLL